MAIKKEKARQAFTYRFVLSKVGMKTDSQLPSEDRCDWRSWG